jgi:phosphoribosyl-AMP cyclohydrolase
MNENPPQTQPDSDALESLRWSVDGLMPAIVQDAHSGEVLMMAWMNREALARTIDSGQTHFFSRSRGKLWHKGATSGHVQNVREIRVDCDADVLLIRVEPRGGACHEGYRSCFFRVLDQDGTWRVCESRVFAPEVVYRDTQSENPT